MYFMSQLTPEGIPKKADFKCKICGRKFKGEGAFHNHIRVHRDGTTTSYHDKDNLWKSWRYNYEC